MKVFNKCLWELPGSRFFPSFCRFYLIQGIRRHACESACLLLRSRPDNHHKHAAAMSAGLHKPTQLRLRPTHTHATGTAKPWPVGSANLKRKTRSWWGAEGLVQRRPVEGCRAEKILCSTNTHKKKKTWKRRKRKEKNHNYWVNEEVRSKIGTCSS